MKKILFLLSVFLIAACSNEPSPEQMINNDKIEEVYFYCIKQINKTIAVWENIISEYTCESEMFNISVKPIFAPHTNVASCYNKTLNSSGGYSRIFWRFVDYGYIENRTVYWAKWTYMGDYTEINNKTVKC